MNASDVIFCKKCSCSMYAKACLLRQDATFRVPTKKRQNNGRPGTVPVHLFCSSGDCEQGLEIREAVVDPPAAAESRFYNRGIPRRLPKRRGLENAGAS